MVAILYHRIIELSHNNFIETYNIAHNSIMKVKLKVLEHVNRSFFYALSAVFFLIMSVAYSGAEFELHYFILLRV